MLLVKILNLIHKYICNEHIIIPMQIYLYLYILPIHYLFLLTNVDPVKISSIFYSKVLF